MTDLKISDLSAIASLGDTDVMEVASGGLPKKITGADLAASINARAADATQAELDAAIAALQPLDSDLTAIAALTTTSFGRSLLALADAAALRTAAVLVPGTDVQAFDSDLAALAGLSIAADTLPYGNGSHTMALATLTSFARSLLDDADAATARATLGAVPWPRKYKSGKYYQTNQGPPADSTVTPVLDRATFNAFPIGEALTIDRIGTGVSTAGTAGAKVRLGIYADTDGAPDALVLDAGTINGDSNTYQEITVSQALSPGTLYWICVVWQVQAVGSGILRASGVGSGAEWIACDALDKDPRICAWSQASVTGALPANATPVLTAGLAQTAAVKVRAV